LLVIGLLTVLTVLTNDVQAFPIETIIVAGTTACGSSRQKRERRLTPCRPMQSYSCWSDRRSCSTDAAAVRAPTTEAGACHRQPEFIILAAR